MSCPATDVLIPRCRSTISDQLKFAKDIPNKQELLDLVRAHYKPSMSSVSTQDRSRSRPSVWGPANSTQPLFVYINRVGSLIVQHHIPKRKLNVSICRLRTSKEIQHRNCVRWPNRVCICIAHPLNHAVYSGAGLGGLALALVLQKDCPDVQVDIYESNMELTEVGAGIGVWPRVWEVLRYLGLEKGLKQAAGARTSL